MKWCPISSENAIKNIQIALKTLEKEYIIPKLTEDDIMKVFKNNKEYIRELLQNIKNYYQVAQEKNLLL